MKRFLFFLLPLLLFLVVSIAPITPAPTASLALAPRVPVEYSTATNWAGYAAEKTFGDPVSDNTVTAVSGQWTVPEVECTKGGNTYSSIFVGIDGYDSNTVQQIGTDQNCFNRRAFYRAWYEMYPAAPVTISSLEVSAGDTISAQVTYDTATGQFTLSLAKNGGTPYQTQQTATTAKRRSAEWIVEAPWFGTTVPLANFGTVTFTNASATIAGTAGSINAAGRQYDPITMVAKSGRQKRAEPSSLTSGGTGFTVTWLRR